MSLYLCLFAYSGVLHIFLLENDVVFLLMSLFVYLRISYPAMYVTSFSGLFIFVCPLHYSNVFLG